MLMEELEGLGTQEMTTVSMTRSVFYFPFSCMQTETY
jgi:hypothetical protein